MFQQSVFLYRTEDGISMYAQGQIKKNRGRTKITLPACAGPVLFPQISPDLIQRRRTVIPSEPIQFSELFHIPLDP